MTAPSPARSGASPMASCAISSLGSRARSPSKAWARATASSSTCRWCPRRRSPCWPAPGSVPSIRWCSADLPPTSSRPASTTPSPRSSSRPPAASSPAVSSPTSRCSMPPSGSPGRSPIAASSCSASRRRRSWSRAATSTGRRRWRRRNRPTASPSPRPTRSTSSTPPAPPASRKAWCATMAATPWRSTGPWMRSMA